MTPASQTDAQVVVGRWSGTYHVPRDYPASRELQRRVDDIVAARLASACSSYLESSLSVNDPSVWRIRNLKMDFSLDAGFSDSQVVVKEWGLRLASQISSIVEGGEENDSFLRFPSRAAFLAQFLADIAAGRAWGKWYYEEFTDLYVLSDRQAICTVFLRRDAPAVELLLQLASTGRLEPVLQSMNDSDGLIIFDLCFESAPTTFREAALQKWTGIVLGLWNTAPLRAGSRQENRFRDALRLLVRTLSQFPAGSGDGQLKAAIHGLLELRRVLSEIHSPAAVDSLIKSLADNNLPSAVALATRAGVRDSLEAVGFFAERMQGDAAWGTQAAAVILGESHQERFLTSKTISEGESVVSSFGGVFLLGPSLEALQFDELTRVAAEPSESPEKNGAILRHLTAMKCLGRSRFLHTADDPALRLFSCFEGTCFFQVLADTDFTLLNLAGARHVLLQTLLGCDEPHPPIFYAELVSFASDSLTFILRDLAHDEWLEVTPVSPSDPSLSEVVQLSLQRVSDLCKRNSPDLFLSDSLFSLLRDSPAHSVLGRVVPLHRMDDPTREQLATLLGLNPSQLDSRLRAAQQQYPYYSLASNWAGLVLDPFLDCTLTLLARAALRHFVRKLLGFESSSPEHVYQNFLSGLSEIRRMGQHLEVRLPSSPLSVVLHMAGLQKQKYMPSWLKGLEVWLLPPQE